MKKRIIALCLLSLLLVAVFTSCMGERVAVDTDTLKVVQNGSQTVVSDLVANREYKFRTARVRKDRLPEEHKEPREAFDTDTIRIVMLPHAVLEITDKTAGKVYTIK